MTNKYIYYVYAYLRSNDSDTAKAGTPYYIGKGKEKRAFSKNHTINLPDDKSNIVFLEKNLSEIGALALERRYIEWYGSAYSNGILRNRTSGGEGISAAKDMNGNVVPTYCNDPRWETGEIVGLNHGKSPMKDRNNKIYHVSVDDSRYLSGELVGIHKNTVLVKGSDKDIFRVSIDDPRYVSGELVGYQSDLILVKTEEGTNEYVSKTDPRVISGELKSLISGRVIVKDSDGRKFFTDVNDPKYISGELIHASIGHKSTEKHKLAASLANKGTVPVVDMTGTISRTRTDDPGLVSGILRNASTSDILIQLDNEEPKWIFPGGKIEPGTKILYQRKQRVAKFIYTTPWGEFDSSGIALKNCPHKSWVGNIESYCRDNKIITGQFKTLISVYGNSIIGKTTSEIGFTRRSKISH